MEGYVRIAADELKRVAKAVFTVRAVEDDCAEISSEVLVEADLRGHSSHGVLRLLKWAPGIEEGAIARDNRMEVAGGWGSVMLFAGNRTLGPVSAVSAMEACLQRAKHTGIAAACVTGASHIGMLGYYVEKAASFGSIGIAMCNTEPALAPPNCLDKMLGTNPIAIGLPSSNGEHIIVDMATSVHARGKVVEAQEAGESIPLGWAQGPDGEPTADPGEALKGALLPFGGIKGYALCLAIDLICGGMSGSAVGSKVAGSNNMKNPSTRGDFYMVIDPDSTVGSQAFTDRADTLIAEMRASRTRDGKTLLLPGEPERITRSERLEEGIPILQATLDKLLYLATEASVGMR